jgi:hypothetical protein
MALRAAQDISNLIAKKSYAKAIELIKEQLKTQRSDPRLRMQLADVLVLSGKGKEAVMILTPLADEFAKEGFAAKAIAVLKRIQKIDPSRREVEAKLAGLIQEKQQLATAAAPSPAAPAFEIGMEEIGFEAPGGSIAVATDEGPGPALPEPEISISRVTPASPAVVPVRREEPHAAPPPAPALELEVEEAGIELESEAEPVLDAAPEPFALAESAPEVPVAAEPLIPVVAEPAPVVPEPAPERPVVILEPEPEPGLAVEAEPIVAAAAEPEFVLDDDEFAPDKGATPESEEPVVATLAGAEGEPITDNLFVDELMSVLEDAFPSGLEAPFTEPIAPQSGGSAQIVVSPLFRHFSVDEMVAVIAGLHLANYQRGQVIIREGEPGDRLFMLSSGKVKAFKKSPAGKQVAIAELEEGAFFGEGAILTGRPRTASIVATTDVELLELDRPTLDSICRTHPHVMDVMREFAAQRAASR